MDSTQTNVLNDSLNLHQLHVVSRKTPPRNASHTYPSFVDFKVMSVLMGGGTLVVTVHLPVAACDNSLFHVLCHLMLLHIHLRALKPKRSWLSRFHGGEASLQQILTYLSLKHATRYGGRTQVRWHRNDKLLVCTTTRNSNRTQSFVS